MINFSDVQHQHKIINKRLVSKFKDILKTNQFVGGRNLDIFEKNFASSINVKFCLGVANGTDALEIAVEALNLKKGSEVIVPVNTWISTAEAVTRNNLKLVFVDIDKNNNLICIDDFKKKITKKTKLVIPVHLYGNLCNMIEIKKICKKNNIKIIEDCAQSYIARKGSKYAGSFGDLATFSFYPGKNLGALGDAGAIVTNNKNYYLKCKMLSNHGRLSKYDHVLIGRNSRLDNLQAGFLNEKLTHIKKWTIKRIENAKIYNKELRFIKNITLPSFDKQSHVFHLYVINCNKRDSLKKYLEKNGVKCGLHYPTPLHKTKAYKKFNGNHHPNASLLAKRILSLPMGIHLTYRDIIKIRDLIKKFYNE